MTSTAERCFVLFALCASILAARSDSAEKDADATCPWNDLWRKEHCEQILKDNMCFFNEKNPMKPDINPETNYVAHVACRKTCLCRKCTIFQS